MSFNFIHSDAITLAQRLLYDDLVFSTLLVAEVDYDRDGYNNEHSCHDGRNNYEDHVRIVVSFIRDFWLLRDDILILVYSDLDLDYFLLNSSDYVSACILISRGWVRDDLI